MKELRGGPMFSYEVGLVFAFLLWLFGAINLLISINSTMERNLNRIGQRLSWLTLRPKPMEESDTRASLSGKIMKFLFINAFGLMFVLFSWGYVALFVGQFIYNHSKDAGAPQAVRELRWRMKNTEMTLDQIIKELMKIQGEDPSSFETFKDNYIRAMQENGITLG
jgi:ABC-type multidrug transport system fused ATPase/permease subunit